MIDYMGLMLADLKVDDLKRSRASHSDTDRSAADKPTWVSKQVGRLLQIVGSKLAYLGEHMTHESRTVVPSSLKGQQ